MVLLTHRSKLNTFRCCVSISNNIFIIKYWELFSLNYNSVSINLPLSAQKFLTVEKLSYGFFHAQQSRTCILLKTIYSSERQFYFDK